MSSAMSFSSRPAPPANWTGPWPPPNGLVGFPSTYPAPPPMPSGYTYGERAWQSGSWMYGPGAAKAGWAGPGPDARAAAMAAARYGRGSVAPAGYGPWPVKPPPNPGSADYWSTELKDNPLQLHNMHIRAPEPPPVSEMQNADLKDGRDPAAQSQHLDPTSLVWIPALSDDGNSHPRREARASSQPPLPGRRSVDARDRSPPPPLPPGAAALSSHGPSSAHPPDLDAKDRHLRSLGAYPDARRPSEDTRRRSSSDRTASFPHAPGAPPAPLVLQPQRRQSHESFDLIARGSRSTAAHTPTRLVADSARAVQRAHTLPGTLAHPQPQPPAFTTQRELRPTFSPGIVRTPQHYDASHGTPPCSPTDDGRGFGIAGPWRGEEWNERDRDRDRQREPRTRRTVEGYEYISRDPLLHSSVPPASSSSSYSQHAAPIVRHSSMPASISSSGVNGVHLSHIREESENQLSPLIFGESLLQPPERSRGGGEARGLERSDTLPAAEFGSTYPSSYRAPQPPSSSRTPSHSPYRNGHDNQPPLSHHHSSTSSSYAAPSDSPPHPTSSHTPARSPREYSSNHNGTMPSLSPSHGPTLAPSHSQYFDRHSESHSPSRMQHSPSYSSPSSISSSSGSSISPNPLPRSPLYRQDESRPGHTSAPSSAYTTPSSSYTPPSSSYTPPSSSQTPPSRQYLYRQDESPSRGSSSAPQSTVHTPIRGKDRTNDSPHHPSSAPRAHSSAPSSTSPQPPRLSPTPARSYHHDDPPSRRTAAPSDPPPLTPSRAPPSSHTLTPPSSHTHAHTPPSSHTHAPAGPSARTPTRPQFRHVRAGYWNRRGDHLTPGGLVAFCPSARTYPKDLAEYPEDAFMDHAGRKVVLPPGQKLREHPDSVAQGGQLPKQPYDTFIKYVLVSYDDRTDRGS